MALLEVRGLTKRFGGLTPVGGVDLSVEAGEIVSVIVPYFWFKRRGWL